MSLHVDSFWKEQLVRNSVPRRKSLVGFHYNSVYLSGNGFAFFYINSTDHLCYMFTGQSNILYKWGRKYHLNVVCSREFKHCYCLLFNNVSVLAISDKDGQYRPYYDGSKWDKEMYTNANAKHKETQTAWTVRGPEPNLLEFFSVTQSALDIWQDI